MNARKPLLGLAAGGLVAGLLLTAPGVARAHEDHPRARLAVHALQHHRHAHHAHHGHLRHRAAVRHHGAWCDYRDVRAWQRAARYYCAPCGRQFRQQARFHRHLHRQHRIALRHLYRHLVHRAFGWVYYG